jgi:hypothetical protein
MKLINLGLDISLCDLLVGAKGTAALAPIDARGKAWYKEERQFDTRWKVK